MNFQHRAEHKPIFLRPIHHDDALVTSVIPYQEADCIVRLFTRQFGFFSAFCKRGLANKKGSSPIQAPAFAKVGFIRKEDKLARLVSCDLDPMFHLLPSLKVFGYSAYIAEVTEKLVPEGDREEEIFALVNDAFSSLRHGAHPSLLRAFEMKLLYLCGYLPEIPSTKDKELQVVGFDPITSRFITEQIEGAFAFSHDALLLLKSMLIAKLGVVKYEGVDELLMIGRLFQNRLKLIGCFPLKSVAFLKQIRAPMTGD